jgi:hypothetical protein
MSTGLVTGKKLIDGYDAGHFDLPDEVKPQRSALERVDNALNEISSPKTLREIRGRDLKDEMIEAALSGSAFPDGSAVVEAEAAIKRNEAALAALRDSKQHFEREVARSLRAAGEAIIVVFLRSALEETIAEARKAAGVLRGINDIDVNDVTPKVRDAWLRMVDLAERYVAIRTGREDLALPMPRHDQGHIFAEFRNARTVWPERSAEMARSAVLTTRRHALTPAPWPDGYPQRLLWIVRSEAQPWMPTPQEQDAAWLRSCEEEKLRIARGQEEYRRRANA